MLFTVVKRELVTDVGVAVAGVVDVDLVEHIVSELVEVRAAVGSLQWDVVGDERDHPGFVRAHEGIDIRAVGDGILRNLRCFAM